MIRGLKLRQTITRRSLTATTLAASATSETLSSSSASSSPSTRAGSSRALHHGQLSASADLSSAASERRWSSSEPKTPGFSTARRPSSAGSTGSFGTTPGASVDGAQSPSRSLLGSERSAGHRNINGGTTDGVNGFSRSPNGGLDGSARMREKADRLLVIGSGVAGSAAALVAAETYNVPVTLLFAGNAPDDCNSNWAQGGIIYRNYDPKSGDSASSLARDIHRAGAGLCDDLAVQKVATEGPDRVRELLLRGGAFASVPFDKRPNGELSLCLEASHAAPRILHYADKTGWLITQHMTQAAAAHPLITMQPQTIVTDLLVEDDMCVGVSTLDRDTGNVGMELATRGTVLASGGLAGIYEHSTNPAGFNALGSSVALAARAGVKLQELEYVQFHPTSLYIPNESRFLLSEALRGEGAVLRDISGRAFAQDFHSDGELAPRDIVARGVFAESQKPNDENKHNVYLDISHRDGDWLHGRFPAIQSHLSRFGLDLAKDQLPVIPAAHYTCGGVSTDLQGRTSLKGLYAAGEAARTGLHGGNRLASTSLLEGLVFGASVADFVAGEAGRDLQHQAKQRMERRETESINSARNATMPNVSPSHQNAHSNRAVELLRQVRRIMWDNVGVVRTPSGLQAAQDALMDIVDETGSLHPSFETAGVRDAAVAGAAVAAASLTNRTSVGAHFIVEDAPMTSYGADSEEDSDEEEAIAAP